jgi:hypothetical protein
VVKEETQEEAEEKVEEEDQPQHLLPTPQLRLL